MRVSEWELWACANHFVERYEAEAPVMAAMRADELLEAGDVEGAHTFAAIIRRIERLLSPPEGPLHQVRLEPIHIRYRHCRGQGGPHSGTPK